MALELELVRSEPTELKGRAMPAEVQDKLPPTVALAAAEARIRGLEEIIEILRERPGMAYSLNIELTKRLEEAHNFADWILLALPKPGQESGVGRPFRRILAATVGGSATVPRGSEKIPRFH